MKQKFRQIFKISLFTTFFAVIGCSEDESRGQNAHENEHPKVKEISFEELLKQPGFSESYGKVAKMMLKDVSSLQARTAMEEEYDFTISTAPAKVIETDSATSYTLKISREIENPSYFENLVVQVSAENKVDAAIFKYTLISEPELTEDGSFTLDASVQATPIVYDGSIADRTGMCFSYSILVCNNDGHGGIGPEHPAGVNCTSVYWTYKTECVDGAGGSSGSGTGGGGGGGNNYTPPTRDPIIITSPNFEEAPIQNPCEKLKGITDNAIISAKLKELRNLTNDDKENATTYHRNGIYVYPVSSISTGEDYAQIKIYPETFGTSHTHEDGVYPMFTPGDLSGICEFAQNYVQPDAGSEINFDDLFFNMMVVESNTAYDSQISENGFAYAMYPNDPARFKTICEVLSDPIKLEDLNQDIKDLYIKAGEWNGVNQEKLAAIFLKFINNVTTADGCGTNFNISLYRRPFDSDHNLTGSWEKLELKALTSNGIKKTPCN